MSFEAEKQSWGITNISVVYVTVTKICSVMIDKIASIEVSKKISSFQNIDA